VSGVATKVGEARDEVVAGGGEVIEIENVVAGHRYGLLIQ
jgi:hypothetical protein